MLRDQLLLLHFRDRAKRVHPSTCARLGPKHDAGALYAKKWAPTVTLDVPVIPKLLQTISEYPQAKPTTNALRLSVN